MAPDSVEVLPGGSVNLTCVAVGSPMPTIRWRLGAVDLTQEHDAPLGRNVLTLTDIRQTATYTCVASSDLGSIEHQAEVQVKGNFIPPTIYGFTHDRNDVFPALRIYGKKVDVDFDYNSFSLIKFFAAVMLRHLLSTTCFLMDFLRLKIAVTVSVIIISAK